MSQTFVPVVFMKTYVGGFASWLARTSPGSSPGLGHCVVFLGKTINFYSVSLYPGEVYKWVPANVVGNPAIDIQGE